MFAVPTAMAVLGIDSSDAFGYVGTLGAFGFLAAYFLLSIAASVYLYRKGWWRPGHIFFVPASFYPVPLYPTNLFTYWATLWSVRSGSRFYLGAPLG